MQKLSETHTRAPGWSEVDRRYLAAVGAKLRKARLRAGLSQDETAARAGVTRPTLSAIENGLADARIITLIRLSAAMGLSAADLFADS